MSLLSIIRNPLGIAALRLVVLAFLVGLPVLAMPAKADRHATLIEGTARPVSGAGLVIVMGIQRAR